MSAPSRTQQGWGGLRSPSRGLIYRPGQGLPSLPRPAFVLQAVRRIRPCESHVHDRALQALYIHQPCYQGLPGPKNMQPLWEQRTSVLWMSGKNAILCASGGE